MGMSPTNKLTLAQVQKEFTDAGCTLLSAEYKDNKAGLRFICYCGCEGVKSLIKFRANKSCKQCGYKATGDKNGRLSLDAVASKFRELGHTLLAEKYKNNASKLPYICKCGAFHKMSFAGVSSGHQCPNCVGRKIWDYASVRDYYASQGCELTAKEYINANGDMPYICSCGAESKTTFGNFYHRGVRCNSCGIQKISGENAHQYKPEKTDAERVTQRKYPAYDIWRKSVFERDAYTCQCCQQVGGKLHAHHLDNYADHKEIRTDVSNGVTLCEPCHRNFHSIYGQKNITTSAQFTEFLKGHNA